MSRLQLATVLLTTWLVAPCHAWADASFDDAFELHQEAIAARDAGDYELAERLFRKSLVVKNLNITWLNLGHLYGLMGKCAGARDAFGRVAQAEAVPAPPRERVLAVLEERTIALAEQCPEGVVDLGEPTTALSPRNYSVPIVLMSLGATGLVAATLIDATVLRAKFDRLEATQSRDRAEYEEAADKTRRLQAANVITFVGSSAVLAAGIVAIAVTAGKDTRVSVAPAPGGLGIVLTQRF